MMMHDQSKLFSNEFYHNEARYGMDDGIIDEFMMASSETLGDLNHLESNLKASNMSNSTLAPNVMPITSEDYFNQFTFNQVTNIMMNNTTNQNTNLNSNQYTYHTMQSPQLQTTNYTNQIMQSNTNLNSYIQLGPNTGGGSGSGGGGTNHYGSKIIHRTSPYNSPLCGSSSSSSSPSSILSSSNLSLNLNQSSNQNVVITSTNDTLDYDNASSTAGTSTSSTIGATVDPAELARQKQIRGLTLTPEEIQLLAKDRQRKDNHNMIERRRRFNINDRIKELGQLLPKNGEYDAKQNKGSILKASVDYIIRIKTENEENKKAVETNKYLVTLNNKLYNRIKELEMLCRTHGIPYQSPQSNETNNLNNLKEANHESYSQFNNTNDLTSNNKLDDTQSVQQHHSNETNSVATIDNCLPKFVYNQNTTTQQFQAHSTSEENFNSTVVRNKSTKIEQTKKRNHSTLNDSDYNNSNKIHKNNNKDSNQKEVKVLKEEPISPKTLLLQQKQQQYLQSQHLIDTYSNFDQSENFKFNKIPLQNQRFVLQQSKIMSRSSDQASQSVKVFIDSEQKDSTNLNSSSKDPTLASSSISSPLSPSSASPSSSSSSDSSLCQN